MILFPFGFIGTNDILSVVHGPVCRFPVGYLNWNKWDEFCGSENIYPIFKNVIGISQTPILRYKFFIMALTPPRRLFHVPSMSTVLYVDVADDVAEKGYAAISHVWGKQKLYSADELGILNGVNWEVPLSNANKISRLVDAMNHHGMEYVWFDVLCMPQDKRDEINLEIPHMGDYYSEAKMTFVLSDTEWRTSEAFSRWLHIAHKCMASHVNCELVLDTNIC